MKITNGLVLAGYDSVISNFESLSSDKKFPNKLFSEMRPGLTCYGAEIVKKTLSKNGQQLHNNATKKILKLYSKYHLKGVPWYQDSGGFQICIGKVPPSYCEYLADYYTQFIQKCCNDKKYDEMLFFYLDLVTTNGITKDFSIEHMKMFQNLLMERTKDTKGYEKVYLVIQSNNELVYDTFYHFIRDNSIHEQLNSHKWASGGLVVLNFNNPLYEVRPYMPAIFDCIDLEYNYLKQGNPVYFHILGTSSYFEMILISWLNILCEYYDIQFIISFDSTAHINNATRSGIVHYIDENNVITKLQTKYKYKDDIVKNNQSNYYFMNKIKKFLFNNINIVQDFDWFTDSGKWSKLGSNALSFYEAWAFGKVFDFIRQKCEEKRDWIINPLKRKNLKQLIYDIMIQINPSFIFSSGKKTFDTHIASRLIQSLDWFEKSLMNKLEINNKSYSLIKRMFYDNSYLATKPHKKRSIDDINNLNQLE